MFLAGPYLFSGDPLEDYLARRRDAALRAAAALSPDEVASRGRAAVLGEIEARFRIPETNLQVEGAHFAEERPLTPEELEAIGADAAEADRFKAVTIAIPYEGEPHLFTCTPTISSAHQPQAEVREGALHVVYLLNEVEEFQLEANFKRLIALIERTLEVTQWQAMAHNQRLRDALEEALPTAVS